MQKMGADQVAYVWLQFKHTILLSQRRSIGNGQGLASLWHDCSVNAARLGPKINSITSMLQCMVREGMLLKERAILDSLGSL